MKGNIILYALLVFLLSACSDPNANKLRDSLKKEYQLEKSDKASNSNMIKSQYKEIELSYNEKYVSDFETLLHNRFETQLQNFEDKELGFWKSLMRPFYYLFTSKQKRQDKMEVKSQQYFSNLDIQNEAQTIYLDYINDVKTLRTRYTNNQYSLSNQPKIDLPEINIDLSAMDDHARAEIICDILADRIGSIVTTYILGIIALIITIIFKHKVDWGRIPKVATFIVPIIVGIIMSSHNDKKLLNNLREQNNNIVNTDFQKIKEDIDKNTTLFYDKF